MTTNIPLSYDYELDEWSTDQVPGLTLSTSEKGLEYIGVDVEKLWRRTAARFSSKKDFLDTLGLALTVTFKRGCNLEKVFIRNRDPTVIEKFKDALNRLGVVRVANPGPEVLTLGRLSMLCPTTHPIWLYKGKEPAHKVFFPALPKPAHCTSFAASVPPGLNWDPYFYAGVLYNVYFDTVINPAPRIPATVQQVVNYCRSGREGKMIRESDKIRYMATIGCTESLAVELGWVRNILDGVMMLSCKVAWAQLRHMLERQPSFGTDSTNTSDAGGEPESSAALVVPASLKRAAMFEHPFQAKHGPSFSGFASPNMPSLESSELDPEERAAREADNIDGGEA